MGKVAKGHDPMAEKRTAVAATGNTLQSVCENYFAPDAKKLRSVSDRQRTLHRLVYPKLGARQIEEIQRKDIVRLLDKIEVRMARPWPISRWPICARCLTGMPYEPSFARLSCAAWRGPSPVHTAANAA